MTDTHVLDPGRHRRQLDEAPVGRGRDEVRQRRLARARRSPDDRREGTGRTARSLDQPAQGAARPQHPGLAAHLVEGARAHPHRERRMAGRGRLLGAVGGGRGTEEVVWAHCGRLSTCSTPLPGPRPPMRPTMRLPTRLTVRPTKRPRSSPRCATDAAGPPGPAHRTTPRTVGARLGRSSRSAASRSPSGA